MPGERAAPEPPHGEQLSGSGWRSARQAQEVDMVGTVGDSRSASRWGAPAAGVLVLATVGGQPSFRCEKLDSADGPR